MNLTDYILIAVLAVIIGGIVFYIRKAKKHGVKCIGCPNAKSCSSSDKGACGSR